MILDYEPLKIWIDVVWKIGTVVMLIWVWWTNRAKVTSARFASLEGEVRKMVSNTAFADALGEINIRCGHHKERTARMESALLSMPTRTELSDLGNKIDRLNSHMGNLAGRLEGLNRVADLMNEFLINQGGKR